MVPSRSAIKLLSLRTAARLAGGLGQGCDPTMILVASAVEANLVNTGLLGSLGDDPADDRGGGLVAAVLELGLDLGVQGAGRDQGGRASGR